MIDRFHSNVAQHNGNYHYGFGLPNETKLEFRTIDGSGNNLTQTDLNAAGTDFSRVGTAHFADGISVPLDGVNPREISNVVVGQGDAGVANAEGLSDFMYAWGQFIDHDLDLSRSDGVTHINIPILPGDPNLPDGGMIKMTRAVIDPATGTDASHPATAVNAITGWLDGSMVYGSDQATGDSLRLSDGHMKTSDGNNLPIVNGMFAAGDVRAAENPALTSLQTLFVREHNHQVDILASKHPDWTGDHLYDQARAIVTAEIQNITYSEFLPHLLGSDAIGPYKGYDPTVDPRITEEFAGAAFRFGHSIVSADTGTLSETGVELSSQDLRDVFFESPAAFEANEGADGMLRHLAAEPSQAMDARIVDDLRNFLSDPPASMDLAAINIQRGRDLGLGTLNETREALGLAPYTDFDQITDDAGTVAALQKAFGEGNVDQVDLWTGGLSEGHAPGAMVGETFQTIISSQFENLRAGDRLWFENQGFSQRELREIENTTLSDVILRNTDVQNIQSDAFVATERHTGEAGGNPPEENPDGPQLVIGSDGIDTLAGGPQSDTLIAGIGRQTLSGAEGGDIFRFQLGGKTTATVTDFEPGLDTLEFASEGGDHARVHIGLAHGNAVVQVGQVRVELVGVKPSEITDHHHDFLIV
jgi:hypothetical protein